MKMGRLVLSYEYQCLLSAVAHAIDNTRQVMTRSCHPLAKMTTGRESGKLWK
jgi:hypothetical protein